MTRRGLVELVTEIITAPPVKASLDNPLCEVSYAGKKGRNSRSLSGQGSVHIEILLLAQPLARQGQGGQHAEFSAVFRIYGPGPKIVDQNLENATLEKTR